MLNRITLCRAAIVVTLGLAVTSGSVMAGDLVLDFNDVTQGYSCCL
jgi:hypothetical protein